MFLMFFGLSFAQSVNLSSSREERIEYVKSLQNLVYFEGKIINTDIQYIGFYFTTSLSQTVYFTCSGSFDNKDLIVNPDVFVEFPRMMNYDPVSVPVLVSYKARSSRKLEKWYTSASKDYKTLFSNKPKALVKNFRTTGYFEVSAKTINDEWEKAELKLDKDFEIALSILPCFN